MSRLAQRFFITGTDTDCGKTYVTVKLLEHFNQLNYTTLGLKPIASGCEMTREGLRNQDALQLQQAASIKLPYDELNPVALQPAIAPHLAADLVNVTLSVQQLRTALQPGLEHPADICFVEGAGGWLTPLNIDETLADFAKSLNCPVILVVGMRLGCINHTLLTWYHMQHCHLPAMHWIANCLNPQMAIQQENLQTLGELLGQPPLAVIPYQGAVVSENLMSCI